MEQEKRIQITFLPWTPLTEEIKIGPVSFLPFYSAKEGILSSAGQKIPDEATRKLLADYFKCYVHADLRPVDTIVVCSHGDDPVRVLSNDEKTEIRKAVDALVFTAIGTQNKTSVSANDRWWVPPTADAFETRTQELYTEMHHFYVVAGSMNHMVQIGTTYFTKPWSTGGSTFSLSETLLASFGKLLATSYGEGEFKDRVFRSLEWFRLAHTEPDAISPSARIVMMTSAFEIILDIGNVSEKKLLIAQRLEELCSCSNSKKETRKTGRKQTEHTYTKMAWWAYDFYELRNDIVHGTPVNSQKLKYGDGWLTQLIVADLVFYECVIRKLLQRGYMNGISNKAVEYAKMMNAGKEFNVWLQLAFNLSFQPDDYKKRLGW